MFLLSFFYFACTAAHHTFTLSLHDAFPILEALGSCATAANWRRRGSFLSGGLSSETGAGFRLTLSTRPPKTGEPCSCTLPGVSCLTSGSAASPSLGGSR